jgi:hypothetical protein
MQETRHHYRSCKSLEKESLQIHRRSCKSPQKESLQIRRRICKSPQKESPQKESMQKESPQKRRQSLWSHRRNLLPNQMITKHDLQHRR